MRHNWWRGIHRRPTGWGTQPLRIQLRLLTSNFRASRFRCRPSGALGYLLCGVFYKHAAPLGLNAAQLVARYPSWGEVSLPNGLGNPTPTDPASVAHFQFSCLPVQMSPRWGFGYLMYAVFYKHAAPLGLNAAQLVARYPSLGEVSSPNGLGNPTPTNSIPILNPANPFNPSNPRFRQMRHVAPLGLNAEKSPVGPISNRRGEVSSPNGLGNPTPTDSTPFSLRHCGRCNAPMN